MKIYIDNLKAKVEADEKVAEEARKAIEIEVVQMRRLNEELKE